MKTQEVPVKEQMNIVLQPDAQQLEEIVVTGYQKIDRRLFTGSAERISASESNIDGVADLSKSLQGRVAGVTVQSVSGTFGAAPKLQIRGASSIYGSQSPLWVVDGVILEDLVQISADELSSGDPATIISSAVAGLNADDIESFQILKDASATALYGAKAMNGVIVVTTKRGKTGSVSVNYTGEFTTRLVPMYRNYNLMNSQEQMGVYLELEDKGWLNYADVVSQSNSGLFGYMYALIDEYNPNTNSFMMENTPSAKAKYLRDAEMINTNWFKELFRMSIVQNHSVSMSSGSERNRNYASLSMYNDPGWSIADNVQRFTGNFNSTTDISNTLAATFTLNGSFRKQQLPGSTNRDVDAAVGEISRDFDINPFSYALNTSRTLNPNNFYRMNYAPFNEKYELENNKIDIKNSDIRFQIDLSWNPIKELEISALGSYRYAKSTNEHKIYETSNTALAYRAAETSTIAKANKFLYVDPERLADLPYTVLPEGGFYNMREYDISNYYTRFQANYNKNFNEVHLTNFLLGAELRSIERTDSYSYGYGYQWLQGGTPFTDYRIIKKNLEGNFDYYGYTESVERAVAGFATASYSYLGKYTGTITGRMDGTNQLGKSAKDKWLPTWSLSGGWKLKEEGFLKDNDVISMLSLRATYGMNAKPAPPDANALIILRNDVTFRPTVGEKESMIYIESNQNNELTWEKQKETNIGLDLGLWNRISLILDVYNRNGYDIISWVKTSGIGGQFYKLANDATMNSKGFEFSLGGRAIRSRDFNWDANMTFSYTKNKITNMRVNPNIFNLIVQGGNNQVGYPSRSLFSLQYAGLTKEGYPQVINEEGDVTVGNVFFQSTTGLENLVYEGPIDAPVQGGLNNSFSYKNWKLNIFFTHQFGGVLRLDPFFQAGYTDLDVMPKEMKNRWMKPGDEFKTTIPSIPDRAQVYLDERLGTAYRAYNYSTERVAKSDYIRLKEIYLTYDVPASFVQKLAMKSVQFKLTASNLALLYADKRLNGQDPEFMKSGGVALPTPRQFTLTLRIGL
jgi:TonB-linked SusC/RagA family outer membrane protein